MPPTAEGGNVSGNKVFMPSMGEGVNEATLVRWLKEPGDPVRGGDPLLEVSTDKVDTEIPAPASGTLMKVMAVEGDTILVNQVIALIGEGEAEVSPPATTGAAAGGEDLATSATFLSSPRPAPEPPPGRHRLDSGVVRRSSPLVRKIAREKNIDLTNIPGSGMAGRITRKDLDAWLARHGSPTPAAEPSTAGDRTPAIRDRQETGDDGAGLVTTIKNGQEMLEGVAIRREPMSRMRSLIARHMEESVRVAPHVTTVFEIDMHKVVQIREKHKESFSKSQGFKLTYTPFLIHAAVQAIKKHPIVNCSVDGNDILFKQDINIGCAVAIDSGLIVPVIKQAQDLSLGGIARRLNDLVTRARNKSLKPDEVRGGTFSVTNPGGFGSLTSNPIINQPQVAILGIGNLTKKPVVIDDMIGIRPIILISLTFDHRVVDGEGGAMYLADLKEILENYQEEPL